MSEERAGAPVAERPRAASAAAVEVTGLTAWYGNHAGVRDITISFDQQRVTAIIGPSGCGKSTLLRCINRMHEVVKGARVEGSILVGGQRIYGADVDPADVRQRIGMVFQRPNPFPTMCVWDNVGVGPKLLGHGGSELSDIIETALKRAGLWDEVRDKLRSPAIELSGGQQQRLCIARCIAVRPEVILMDEPCSALDPAATIRIEDLMRELAREYAVIIVTHNMHQAARVSDYTAFLLAGDDGAGRLVEYADTDTIFTRPSDDRTEAYVTGRFG
ncbi:MAG: phosphate ABC transporter ATP-binding protein [Dehalococcoidia bacterium]|nr:MAG: phosphate ABC transporter ATP-binding protein [Dehalococcoidia bacterium]